MHLLRLPCRFSQSRRRLRFWPARLRAASREPICQWRRALAHHLVLRRALLGGRGLKESVSTLARRAAHLRYRIGTLSPIDPSDLEPDRVDVLQICAHTTVCKRNLEMRARSARKIFFFGHLSDALDTDFWPDGQKNIKALVLIVPLN